MFFSEPIKFFRVAKRPYNANIDELIEETLIFRAPHKKAVNRFLKKNGLLSICENPIEIGAAYVDMRLDRKGKVVH